MKQIDKYEEGLLRKISKMYTDGNNNYQFIDFEAKTIIKLIQIGIIDENAFIPLHTLKSNCFRIKNDYYPFTKEFVSKEKNSPFLQIYQATIAGISEGIIKGTKE